uniref:IS3 family transposase n=1 Tax=Prevotella sp. GTC17259 TaxID=3236795 RepID=A0AB33J7X2_9BACT
MSQGEEYCRLKGCVSFLCGYLGISRQGYYRHVERSMDVDVLRTSIVLYAGEVLKDMPKAGMRELYALCRRKFGPKFTLGRDQCYALFRSNGLCQRRRKRPRATFSNHGYFIYGDLVNTTPKLRPHRLGELCVADITYVATSSGWAYLSLVTDAASRVILGWVLHPTLAREGPIQAMQMAMGCYREYGVDLTLLIHHSDRGVQYCCHEYVSLLERSGIRISMTQTGDPLHNALAERMNNTVKNGWLFDTHDKSFEEVSQLVAKAVRLYNTVRPHQSLEMRTPQQELLRLLGRAA